MAVSFLTKARARGLTVGNVLAYLAQFFSNKAGLFWGTVRLRLKARLFGIHLEPGVHAHGTVDLIRWPGGEIHLAKNVHIISSRTRATAASLAFPTRLRVFGPGAAIEIGEGSELSGASITARSTRITLGKKVLLGPNCVIVDSDFHEPWPCERRASDPGYERDSPVTIDDYVWVGMHTLILKGVHIGRGAIIGAGSVVTRDVPPLALACGNPCRIIRIMQEREADPEVGK